MTPIFTSWSIPDPLNPILAAPAAAPALATDGIAINGAREITVWTQPSALVTDYAWRLWVFAEAEAIWSVFRGSASGALGTMPEAAPFTMNRHVLRVYPQLTGLAGAGAGVNFFVVGISQEAEGK